MGSLYIGADMSIRLNDLYIEDQRGNPMILLKKLYVQPSAQTLLSKHIIIQNISIDTPELYLKEYPEGLNLQFLIDAFSTSDTTSTSSSTQALSVKHLHIHNGIFSYENTDALSIASGTIDFNKLFLQNIEFVATQVHIDRSVQATIRNLHFYEHCGFHLKHMQGKFVLNDTSIILDKAHIITGQSRIRGSIGLIFQSFEDFDDFEHKVRFQTTFQEARIHTGDIQFFSTDIPQLGSLEISGIFTGPLAQLRIQECKVHAIQNTYLFFDAFISGLPDIDNTFFDLNIHHIDIPLYDIFVISRTFSLPEQLNDYVSNLQFLSLKGYVVGFWHQLTTHLHITSNTGIIETNVNLNMQESRISYTGEIHTENFDLGLFFKNRSIGKMSASLQVEGANLDLQTLELKTRGQIASIEFNNYNYKNIVLQASLLKKTFQGNVSIFDPHIAFDFRGRIDFSDSIPFYDFTADIQHLNLQKLKISNSEKTISLSTQLSMKGVGTHLDNFQGEIATRNLYIHQDNEQFFLEHLHIRQNIQSNQIKNFSISSDLIELTINGNLQYASATEYFRAFLSEYFTGYTDTLTSVTEGYAQISLNVKNFTPISKLFIPSITLSPNTSILGRFDSKNNSVFLKIIADTILIYNNAFIHNNLNIETFHKTIYTTLNTQSIQTQAGQIDNFIMSSVIKQNFINFSLFWDNYDPINTFNGYIAGNITITPDKILSLSFTPSEFTIDNTLWIIPGGLMQFSSDAILVDNLSIYNSDQLITISGASSLTKPEEKILIGLQNFETKNFSNFMKSHDLPIVDAKLNGILTFENLFERPVLMAQLQTSNFQIDQKSWGGIQATLSVDLKDLKGNASLSSMIARDTVLFQPLVINGTFEFADTPYLDMTCKFSRFDLRLLEPFVQEHLKIQSGTLSGNVQMVGGPKNFSTTGTLQFVRSVLFINYLNTYFLVTDSLMIRDNLIYNPQFMITDARGKRASAQIAVNMKNFSDPHFDIRLNTLGDFLVMNTTSAHNDVFYGKAFINGSVSLTGTPENLKLFISGKTGSGTEFFLPLTSAGTISEKDFITFVSHQQLQKQELTEKEISSTYYSVQLDLEITPDAQVQIIFDPTIGDILRARSTGNLKIDITPDEFTMFGNLKVEEGDYLFTLENIVNKRFNIQKGSSIFWQGDPYNATLDVTAIYSTRARLYDLIKHIDSSDVYRTKIPINVELVLKNNLMSPDISFRITLPQGNENAMNLMQSAIHSDQELNRQVFALLMLNSFLPPEASFQQQTSLGLGTTSMEFLSNQFSNWLSQISKDFDIGLKYRAAQGDLSSELEVAITTHLFQDRVRVEGNVGVGGREAMREQNMVMGNVQVEYKLTPDGSISLKGFNRSNAFDALIKNSPYTQGVGIFIRKEFDRPREIWMRRDEKERKKKRQPVADK